MLGYNISVQNKNMFDYLLWPVRCPLVPWTWQRRVQCVRCSQRRTQSPAPEWCLWETRMSCRCSGSTQGCWGPPGRTHHTQLHLLPCWSPTRIVTLLHTNTQTQPTHSSSPLLITSPHCDPTAHIHTQLHTFPFSPNIDSSSTTARWLSTPIMTFLITRYTSGVLVPHVSVLGLKMRLHTMCNVP